MARLKDCPACGNEVSSKAKACPKCGHKISKNLEDSGCGIIILLVIGILIAVFIINLGL